MTKTEIQTIFTENKVFIGKMLSMGIVINTVASIVLYAYDNNFLLQLFAISLFLTMIIFTKSKKVDNMEVGRPTIRESQIVEEDNVEPDIDLNDPKVRNYLNIKASMLKQGFDVGTLDKVEIKL